MTCFMLPTNTHRISTFSIEYGFKLDIRQLEMRYSSSQQTECDGTETNWGKARDRWEEGMGFGQGSVQWRRELGPGY
ncbi:hypothetical protein E3N88_04035 [Mikania micrantha]|uniref:Uncharacterized protein n=1 Tax=Mikania micrantha TaxID=192012 RepID=A0A5N6PUJ7_9ASTR|nr:hypothetical protein E3N88_04035 [Mikania micrantha]